MKAFVFFALLLAAGAAFYLLGGPEKLGFAQPSELPDTITPPKATFLGSEQNNPFAE